MSADIHGLVGAYAVDAVDEQERAAFERHLAECPECQAEVAGMCEAATSLSALVATTPPPSLRDSVLSGIRTIRPLPPLEAGHDEVVGLEAEPEAEPEATVLPFRSRRPVVAWFASAAAAAVLLVGGLTWAPWNNDSPNQVSATEQVLAASDAQRVEQTINGARTTIVRSASLGKAVVIADNMPKAPDGKDFQFWLNQPNTGMVSAGVLPHGSGPKVTMLLTGDATTALAAGITLEPAGGSPEPTSAPLALFAFS